ncbi:hypothetical protein HZH68_001186 [Vespula germanica]|uniref:Uncharacterized protein n=1 Tax=Vespula germanica TaxID=30212 RepID=A0A834U6P1_VESGE|nr:hypothetical protein HZH68_001186 [Vespula germanica]
MGSLEVLSKWNLNRTRLCLIEYVQARVSKQAIKRRCKQRDFNTRLASSSAIIQKDRQDVKDDMALTNEDAILLLVEVERARAQGCRFSVSGQRAPVYGIMIDRETSVGGMEVEKEEEEAKEDERCDGCERRCKRNEARRDAFRDPFTRLETLLLCQPHVYNNEETYYSRNPNVILVSFMQIELMARGQTRQNFNSTFCEIALNAKVCLRMETHLEQQRTKVYFDQAVNVSTNFPETLLLKAVGKLSTARTVRATYTGREQNEIEARYRHLYPLAMLA